MTGRRPRSTLPGRAAAATGPAESVGPGAGARRCGLDTPRTWAPVDPPAARTRSPTPRACERRRSRQRETTHPAPTGAPGTYEPSSGRRSPRHEDAPRPELRTANDPQPAGRCKGQRRFLTGFLAWTAQIAPV